MDFKILDKGGVWLQNQAQFAFIDPTNGVRFEPGEVVKATLTEWVKEQPTIKKVDDPTKEPEAPKA